MDFELIKNNYIYSIYKKGKIRESRIERSFDSKVDIEMLWDQAGEEYNHDVEDLVMDEDGILKIIVRIGEDFFALINEDYFDKCDDNGNWNH